VAQSKILVDTNAYFRLAQSIRPLLRTEFGEPQYCLYVIKELQDEYNKSARLRNKFPWVNDPEYSDNRSHRLQLSRQERKEIEQAFDFMFDHKRELPTPRYRGWTSPCLLMPMCLVCRSSLTTRICWHWQKTSVSLHSRR